MSWQWWRCMFRATEHEAVESGTVNRHDLRVSAGRSSCRLMHDIPPSLLLARAIRAATLAFKYHAVAAWHPEVLNRFFWTGRG